jgi:hypothetical protein
MSDILVTFLQGEPRPALALHGFARDVLVER